MNSVAQLTLKIALKERAAINVENCIFKTMAVTECAQRARELEFWARGD